MQVVHDALCLYDPGKGVVAVGSFLSNPLLYIAGTYIIRHLIFSPKPYNVPVPREIYGLSKTP